LFEVEISSIEPLRNLVKALAAVLDEGCFHMDEARIALLGMDSSHIAMVDFELPREFFDNNARRARYSRRIK
jgi:DNA polymerase III sliding clamp (beta) subunit (PCNA family)